MIGDARLKSADAPGNRLSDGPETEDAEEVFDKLVPEVAYLIAPLVQLNWVWK